MEITEKHCVALVEQQLAAYNERNVEAFCACYAEDVSVYKVGEENPFLKGIAAFHDRYKTLFSNSPNLHGTIKHRIVLPPFVVDEENVTGRLGADVHAVAIYQVGLKKIEKVWFVT
jgi:hypothetical protein